MLAPHAVDIAVTISSLIASLCFTFTELFDDIFLFVKSSCVLVSGNTNKSLRPKEGSTDRPSEWIRARSLNSYFAFSKIVVKMSTSRIIHDRQLRNCVTTVTIVMWQSSSCAMLKARVHAAMSFVLEASAFEKIIYIQIPSSLRTQTYFRRQGPAGNTSAFAG